jgi:fibronectin-binding autotransporter adhesin
MLLMSWLNALKSGLIRGHWSSRRRMTGSTLRRGDHAPIAVRTETLEDRALLATITVDDDGPANYSTINAAIAAAANNDVIIVAPGTYREDIFINKTVELRGANFGLSASGDANRALRGAGTIIEPLATGNAVGLRINASGVTVDGFDFLGAGVTGGELAQVQVSATNASLRNNVFNSQLNDPFQSTSGEPFTTRNAIGVLTAFGTNYSGLLVENSFFARQRTGVYLNPGSPALTSVTVTSNQFTSRTGLNADEGFSTGAVLNVTNNTLGLTTVDGQPLGPVTGINIGQIVNGMTVNVTGNSISTNSQGLRIAAMAAGGTLDVSGNTFTDHTNIALGLRVNAAAGSNITTSGNTFRNAFFVSNEGPAIFSIAANNGNLGSGDFTFAGASRTQLFGVADRVFDGVDLSGLGAVSLRAGNVYVTPNSFINPVTTTPSIQRGIDAALSGNTVNIAAGTYTGNLTTTKGLTFVGDGSGTTTIAGGASPGITINAPAMALTLQNLTLSGTPPIQNNAGATVTLINAVVNNPNTGNSSGEGTSGSDSIEVRNNAGTVQVRINGGTWTDVGNGTLTLNGGGGNDTITLDYSTGDPVPAGGIVVNGQGQASTPGDTLVLIGTGTQNPTYTPDPVNFGNGTITFPGNNPITFTGLEPVDFDTMGTLTLTLPGAADNVTFTNGTIGGNAAVTISGDSGGVAFEVANVRNSAIVVNTTVFDGDDTITLTSVQAAAGITDLTINTGVGTDTVTISGTTSITGNLSVTTAGALTGAGNVSAGGTASLTAAGVNLTGVVMVTGNTTVSAGPNVVSLANTSNDFGGEVAVTASDVTIVDVDDLTLGAVTASAGQVVTLSTDLNINAAVSATANIVLQPSPLSQTIGLGGGAGAFTLTEAELQRLSTAALVAIGRADMGGGTGAVDINNLDLSGETYDLTVRGGGISLDSITLASGKALTLNSNGGGITDTNAGATNITAGTAVLASALGIGSGNALETNVDNLSATATSSGNIEIVETSGLTISNPVTAANGLVNISANGLLSTVAPIAGNISASSTVTLTANNMALLGTITGGTGVTLAPTAGTAISLGDGTTGLNLTNTELNLVTVTSGSLTIGGGSAGAVSIDDPINTAGAANLVVTSGGAVTFIETGSLQTAASVTLSGTSIGSTSSATTLITAPTAVTLTGTTGGIGSLVNPISLASTSALSATTGGNALAVFNAPGATVGLALLNAGTGTVELREGTFNLNSSTVVTDTTRLELVNNPTLGVGANTETIGGLTMKSGSITGGGSLTSASTFLVEGGLIDVVLAGTTGAVGLTKSTGGIVTLTGANTFTGPVSITDGNLTLNNAGGNALDNGMAVTIANVANAVLTLSTPETIGSLAGVGPMGGVNLNANTLTTGAAGSTSFGGSISGSAGALTKVGATTFTLAGANTYTGATTINAGRLDVNGSVTSNVTVNAPGTLGGSGTITGNVSGDGTVAPGNSPGVLTITGNFTPTGTVAFEVDAPAVTAGTNYDQIIVSGTVDLSGATLTFSGTAGTVASGQIIKLIDKTSGGATVASGSPANGATVSIGGKPYRIFYNGGDGNDVILVENSLTTIYVDDNFSGTVGQVIADADLGTTVAEPAVFGVTAFSTVAAGISAAAAAGTIIVNSGTYAEAVSLTGTRTLRITGADVAGAVTINSLTTAAGQTVNIVGTSNLTLGAGSVAGVVSGAGSLTKTGSGTLTLSGTNTYSGGTNLNGGVVSISADANLGSTATTNPVTFNGGTLTRTGGTISTGRGFVVNAPGGGTVNLGGGSLVFSTTNTLTGTGTLTVNNTAPSSDSFSAAASQPNFNGGLVIDNGRLVNGAGNLGSAVSGWATITLQNGGNIHNGSGTWANNFRLSGSGEGVRGVFRAGQTINGTVTLIGNTTISSENSNTINGVISSTGTFTLTLGGGAANSTNPGNVIALTNTGNTFTGPIVINTGVVRIAAEGSLGATTNAITLNNVATLRAAGSGITLSAGRTITLGAGTATIDTNGNSMTVSSAVTGAGTLSKVGAGILTMSATNTATGDTLVHGGTLRLAAANQIPDGVGAGVLLVGTGATLDLNGQSETVNGLFGAGTVTNGTASSVTLLVGNANTTSSFTGVIQNGLGTTSLEKVGTGTLNLAGNNTYTGATTVTAGTIRLGFPTTFAGAPLVRLDATQLSTLFQNANGTGPVTTAGQPVGFWGDTTGGNEFAQPDNTNRRPTYQTSGGINGLPVIRFDGDTAENDLLRSLSAFTPGLVLIVNRTTSLGGFDGIFGQHGGDDGIRVDGVNWVPSGNAVDRSTVLSLGGGAGLAAVSAVGPQLLGITGPIAGSGTYSIGSYFGPATRGMGGDIGEVIIFSQGFSSADRFTTESYLLSKWGLTGGVSALPSSVIPDGSAVVVAGGAFLDLNGKSTETIGSLAGGGTVTSGAAGAVTLTTGGDGTNTNFSGVIQNGSGTVSVVKAGAGVMTLSGANTYTGTTTVNTGTLLVNGSTATGSAVTVNNAAVLGGTGSIGGSVTLAASSTTTLSPGSPVTGTADLATGDLALNAGTTFQVQVNGNTLDTQYDQVAVTGSVNLGGATLNTSGTITSVPGQVIVLISNDGSDAVTGTFNGLPESSTVTINTVGFNLSYVGGSNNNDVVLVQAQTTVFLTGGNLVITDVNGGTSNDLLTIQADTANSRYVITSTNPLETLYAGPGTTQVTAFVVHVPFASVTGEIQVNTLAGDDNLTVDFSLGNFPRPVVFSAGTESLGGGDAMTLVGGSVFTTVTHTFVDNNDGSVAVTGNGLITYTGLEPITDNLDAANRVFTFTGANETIDLTASGANSQLDSTLGESVLFVHPTTSLTINSTNGTDAINLTSIGSSFNANVTVNSNSTSTVNFNSTVLNVGAGNFAVDAAGTVNFSAGGLTTTGNATLSNIGATGVTADAMNVDIAANGLTISSVGAVGTVANPLRTSVTTVTSASTTGAGSAIFLTETDGVTLTSVTTTDGAITISAGGTVTATSVTAGGTARDVRITTTGGTSDIALGLVTAAGDLVSLNAGGAITDNNAALNNIASATLALQATTGIGNSDAIETALTGLDIAFVNTTSGDVQVTNTGTLEVFNVDGIGGTGASASRNLGGAVTLTAIAGDLIFVEDATAQGDFTIRTPENGAGSSGQNDVNFDTAVVTSTTGNIVIESGDDIGGGNVGVLRTLYAPTGHIRLRSSFNDADGDGRQSWGLAHIEAGTYIALEVGAPAEAFVQSADSRFIAASLELRGLGATGNSFTLDGTNNDVDTLAGSTRGLIRYVDIDGLTIGTVNGIGTAVGLSNALGTAAITLTTGGALVIDDDVSAHPSDAAGTIRFNVTGTITQNAGDDITGFGLALSGTGTTTLTNAGNDVVEFASDRNGELAYTDASALRLDTVAGLNGVTMGTNTVTLSTSGTLDHEGATGNLVAGSVRILGSGNVSLPTLGRNAVGTLAISRSSGLVDFTDNDALTIGTVTGTLGASAGTTSGILTTGDVTVATNTLALTLDQNVTTNTTATIVRLQGATDLIQNGTSVVTGATLGARAVTGSIDLDSINQVGTFASASGTTTVFRNGQALVVNQVAASSGFTPTATGMTGSDLEVVTTAGGIQFARASTASGTFRIQAGGGDVTQTGGTVLSAANLGARATGNVDLDNATNTVSGNFAAVSTGTGFIAFLDAGGFTVGTVAAGQFFGAVTGVTTNDGLIDLNTSGNLTVTDVVTAVGTGRNVTLTTTAGGNVSLNGIVTADGDVVNITSAGNITDSPANTVNNITAATINLNAVTGIGATGLPGAVETTAATVNATNTTSGGIFLNSLSVVNFNNIQAQTAGDIELTSSLAATLTTVNAASGNVTGVVTSGNLTVATSVTAGGTGDISLTTVAGNIVLTGMTTALADDVTLTSSGSIAGTGLVSGNTLTGLAGTGIGVSTVNRVQTAVSLIRLNAAGGDVYLNNTSAALTTYSLVSPAGVGINASGLVNLITSNDLTIANGARVTAGGSITLQGGAANSGAIITLEGTLDGGGAELVLGGTGADAIIVNDMSDTNPVDLNGQAGSDSYTVNYFNAFMPTTSANINVIDSSSSLADNDTLNIFGTNAADELNVKEDTWLGGSFRTTITGVRMGRVNYIAPTPSNARLTTLNVHGLDGQDTFRVSPSRYFTINIFGGTPSFGPGAGDVPLVGLGDTLDFDPNGQNFTIEGRSILTSSFGIAAPSLQPVRFSNIENLPLREIGEGTRYFDFDGTYPTTPRTYSPTQPGYTQVLASDLYVEGNTAYTFVPSGTTYTTRRFGWEALRNSSNVLLTDANGFFVSPVETFDLASVGSLATPYASLLRDGHWSGSSNIRKSIFRFEVPNPGSNAGKWYVVSVKVGKPGGNVDQMRVKNADDPDPIFYQANNITVANQQYGEFKFPVRANSNGEIRLEFSDNGGVEPHWYVNSLELRPGQLLSFGSPPTTLEANGQQIDTHTIYGAIPGSVVTITSSLGTLQLGGDIDPAMQGLQVLVNGSGQAQFLLQRPSGPGLAFLQYDAISAIEGTFENTGFGEIDFVAPPTRRFDFGVFNSPVQTPVWAPGSPDGYVPVTTSSAYTATSGFGWLGAAALNINYNVSLVSTNANLLRDANWDTAPRQFAIDLPAGTYQFTATVGSISVAGQNFSVVSGGTAIDLSQVTNFSTTAGQYKTLNFTVTKTGTAPLVLDFRNLNSGFQWSINGLEARAVGTVTAISVTPPVGPAQADGTTVDTFTVTGAGIGTGTRLFTIATTLGTLAQINGAAIVDADPNYAGIQFDPASDTFTVQVTRPGGPGVATVSVDEVTGAARGSGSRTYTAFSGPRQYDFGTLTSPIQTGYTGVFPTTIYSAGTGFGWLAANTSAVDRGVPPLAATRPDLTRDSANALSAGTFRTDLVPSTTYEVTATLGDTDPRDGVNVRYSVDGGATFLSGLVGVNTAGGARVHRTFTVTTGALGSLIIEISDGGGTAPSWSLAALEIRTPVTPFSISGTATEAANGTSVDSYSVTGATTGAVYTISSAIGTVVTADADAYYAGVQIVAPSPNFSVQIQRPNTPGVNSISVSEVTGASRSAVASTNFTASASRWYDFNAVGSPTQAGFVGVSPTAAYNVGTGFGWVSTTGIEGKNFPGSGDLLSDHQWHRTGAQFRLDVAAAPIGQTIVLQFRDPFARVFSLQVLNTSGTPIPFSAGGPTVTTLSYTVLQNVSQTLTLTLQAAVPAGNIRVNFIGRFSVAAIQFSTPQLAAVEYVGDNAGEISASQLAATVEVAKARWLGLGLTAAQQAVLAEADIQLADFGADRHLGVAYDGRTARIDDDAAGYGWFVDGSALDDSEFVPQTGTVLQAATGAAAGQFDLLTVVMHELGNLFRLSGAGLPESAADLMLPTLGLGTRRLPGAVQGLVPVSSNSATVSGGDTAGAVVDVVLDDRTPFGQTVKSSVVVAGSVAAPELPVALPRKSVENETTDYDAYFTLVGKKDDLLPF